MDKPKTEKKTTRTGKRMGMKNRCLVSISVNDPDRNVSRLWEHLKRHYSRKRIPAAELAKTVFLRGMTCLLEEIEEEYQRNAQELAMERTQQQTTFNFQ